MMQDFLKGTSLVFQGILFFYRTPSLWKYSAVPLFLVLIFYVLIFYLSFRFALPWILDFLPDPANHTLWLRWLIYPLRWLTAISCGTALLLVSYQTLSTLYEITGSLFFDAMIVEIEKTRYSHTAVPLSFRQNLAGALQSVGYSIGTLLITIILLPLGLLIPVIGVVLMTLVLGWRQGQTYIFSSGFNRGYSLPEIRRIAEKRKMLLLGFGTTIYLLYLIPVAAIPLIPGYIVSGVLLFNEELSGQP